MNGARAPCVTTFYRDRGRLFAGHITLDQLGALPPFGAFDTAVLSFHRTSNSSARLAAAARRQPAAH